MADDDSAGLLQSFDRNGVVRSDEVGKNPRPLCDTPALDPDIILHDDGNTRERHIVAALGAAIYHAASASVRSISTVTTALSTLASSDAIEGLADDFHGRRASGRDGGNDLAHIHRPSPRPVRPFL